MPKNATPENFLAAGPWCFCGQEKDFPDWPKKFTFAPEPLASSSRLPAAARAAQTLAVRMVRPMTQRLYEKADMLPAAYWQILLMPWLIDVAAQIVERSLRLDAMINIWGENKLAVTVLPRQCKFDFQDEHDFTLRGSLGSTFNHWLFSSMLRDRKPDSWILEELPEPVQNRQSTSPSTLADMLRKKAREISLRLLFPVAKGMSSIQALRFSQSLNHRCNTPDHSLDLDTAFNYQSDLDAISLPDDIEAIFWLTMPASIKKLRHGAIKTDKSAPRLRMVNIVAHENCRYRQRLARWRAQGNRLAHSQHGGNYGMLKTGCASELVEYSQDIFFTWGWTTHGQHKGNFIALPSVQLSKELNSGNPQKDAALIFIGTEMSAYGHRLDSLPTPMQYVDYREAKAVFFRELAPEIQLHSFYRPYFPLPGTLEDAQWLLPQFSFLRLCKGKLLPQLLNCKLAVIDHHGTTLLETMAADVPILLYWDRKAWPLTAEAEILLDILEEAGIWHPDPSAAARKANEIWHAPQKWWQSSEVRSARNIFCKHQALAVPNPDPAWITTLQQL